MRLPIALTYDTVEVKIRMQQSQKQKEKIIISLSKQEHAELKNIALSFGFSLSEFSSRLLQQFLRELPKESLNDFEHPKALTRSLKRALQEYKHGKLAPKL
ncbi:MAG TPA: hypothetical protein DCY48_00625 [Candidatus Magasanikbacteria bacterium]|nr:MAG: hypothetical protein A3I74_02205 [Candidatus Magasanikbacteria bacterium RIFCSPLOWO2_02_FULL_47_16]OGH79678.1 MAG: hypothetical protein A3C10_01195 [Candidatus Magasanikbacteria bacterium RIFCSPHIGHO2_02_FULL_48_18]OGH82455.1 MAG: hypothetical protein A3G08_01165 [Candidatus Magasanikbacteria bacterium RIFCSPLOWO2_12_FULL_47_9b]HAZ28265.1 hypothetical protein [Candidatus Magasanikbacteria bacterium]